MQYDLLLVGRNSNHKKLLQEAFPEAYVVTPGESLMGYGFKKIVLVGLEFTATEKERFEEWYKTNLVIKLLPNNGGIHSV